MKEESGFTLIEFLVAMSLFVTLSGIVATSFTNILRSQKSVLSLIAANDNASLSLEQFAREARTGFGFTTYNESRELCFTNAHNEPVVYALLDEAIGRGGGVSGETCREARAALEAITSPDVKATSLIFNLQGADPGGDGSPTLIRTTLTIVGGRGPAQNIAINLQTSVSSRILEE